MKHSQSFPRWSELSQPSWAQQIIEARPEARLDGAMDSFLQACSKRTHGWVTHPFMREHPAFLLTVFACTGTAVGSTRWLSVSSRRAREMAVDHGLRMGPEFLQSHMGAVPAVLAAVMCDAVGVSMAAACNTAACVVGSVVGLASPFAAVPFVCAMPEGARRVLADGLRSYFIMHERLAEFEAFVSPSAWRASGRRDKQPASRRQRFNEAMGRLKNQVSVLSAPADPCATLPPPQANFYYVARYTADNPTVARLLNVPQLPMNLQLARAPAETRAPARPEARRATSEVLL